MTENNDKINQLFEKLEKLSQKQELFLNEINKLKAEIASLKTIQIEEVPEKEIEDIALHSVVEILNETIIAPVQQEAEKISVKTTPKETTEAVEEQIGKSNIEKFIGENLINKIGIAITVIGVAIGAKYSIEHDLISPLTRIILGYLFGLGLLGIGIRLKKNYENYSAVLVSGAMAIMFFITFAAYSLYDLFPQLMAFVLMVVFTAFTVIAAIYYNRQVIAHIGLVGAYAVPFLLSDGSGKVAVLFTYMAIINLGILIIAFKKYWKFLYYAAFLLTWLIFAGWYAARYEVHLHFLLAFTFLTIFFATFYVIFLAYKLIRKEIFDIFDILLLLANSFIFFGLGYAVLDSHSIGVQLLGIFTLCNAVVHFFVSLVIYKQKLADRNLFYLVSGLVLVFITIAIPVQLTGHWVTLLWVCEAALLFWIGRTKKVSVYEILSFALMILAFISLVQDWLNAYIGLLSFTSYPILTPVFNVTFMTSAIFIGVFVFINYLNTSNKHESSLAEQKSLIGFISFMIPAILITSIFFAFRFEISNYFNQLYAGSVISIKNLSDTYPESFRNADIKKFESIWLVNYTFLFFTLLTFISIRKFKNKILGYVSTGITALEMLIFLTAGLYILSELRESYLNQTLAEYYNKSAFYIGIRYINFAFVALALASIYSFINQVYMKKALGGLQIAFDFLLYTTILWVASSELINIMDLMQFTQSYKLGLSILWGVYSLMLIGLGIWKNKKYLRISAIALFGVTLIKLFVYDISHLNTIAKTIVFVSLGILLLIISFLYNKYKKIIF